MKPTLLAAIGAATVFVAASAAAEPIVIVHGAFQSAADWAEVGRLLEQKGHDVTLVDLPGRDAAGAAAKAVTLDAYRDAVLAAARAHGQPVALVGHSFGGFAISLAAESDPEVVGRLIYVAAYVPENGESMEKIAYTDVDNAFTEDSFVIAPDYAHAEVLDRDRATIFANDADAATRDAILSGMVREPLGPIAAEAALGAAFASVPKAYVRTLRDNAVSTPLQSRMIERAGIEDVVDIDAGHAPMHTAPEDLAEAIDRLVAGA